MFNDKRGDDLNVVLDGLLENFIENKYKLPPARVCSLLIFGSLYAGNLGTAHTPRTSMAMDLVWAKDHKTS
jgi:hypothetical protein